MSSSRPVLKVIAIGYNTEGTGLTRVMNSIMRRLADRHEIHFLGIGYSGSIIRHQGLTIYPTNLKGGDIFAAFQAMRMIEEIKPDLLFIMHDIWVFEYYLRLLGPYRDRLKTIAYIPLDGKIINEEDAAPLEQCDRVVAYTPFGQNEFEQAFRRLRDKRGTGAFPAVDVIPHGVDQNAFFPLPELAGAGFDSRRRAEAKRRVFGAFPGLENSFVVLNASRPDERKRLDLTIAGFARFAAGKPSNVRLCVHYAIRGNPEEQRIAALIREHGIGERVLMRPLGPDPVNDSRLNLLYNACDVGINTAMGEGWGLVSFEHAAAGAPQVVPDHTACAVLWRGHAELIPVVKSYIPRFSVLEMGEVAVDGVAEALERLYSNPRHAERLARAGLALTQKPEYCWDFIPQRFDDLFVSLAQ
jgi:glycosyltransferase involved in cell wall biosynthesis